MNQDDIIRMAREAGIDAEKDTLCRFEGWVEPLKRFAALVIANNPPQSSMSWQEGFEAGKQAEREECAKVADEWVKAYPHPSETIAAAIRARGNVREHVMSGDCWCNPELNYTDPETGAEVWVHKEPQ